MKGVGSDVAAQEIKKACEKKIGGSAWKNQPTYPRQLQEMQTDDFDNSEGERF